MRKTIRNEGIKTFSDRLFGDGVRVFAGTRLPRRAANASVTACAGILWLTICTLPVIAEEAA